MNMMEIKELIYKTLRLIGYVLGFIGIVKLFGAAGAYEWDYITTGEFVYHEFISMVLILTCYIVYIIRENFRIRYMRRRVKRTY